MAEINVKICDRCGKSIDYHTIPWLIIPYQSGDDSRYKFDEMTRTLCEECVTSLTDWLLMITDADRRKLENAVDQGAFDRIHVITAEELKKIFERNITLTSK